MQFARSSWQATPRCRASRARPPRFVVFRDAIGGSQVAIIVGKPDFSNAVPVRLHSACLTGDVFGSRRCDCGDQLRLALALLEDLGGGIILYLAQEARRLGLANKMRTYQSQDDGLDTFDANTTLGFDDDERDYGIAARMLRMLNCTRTVLLTNIGLSTPLEAPINAENRRYMTVKAVRAGHRAVGPPGHSLFGLRSSCDRAELMLALVTRVAPVSTLAATCSPIEAARAVLTPS